MASFQSGAGWSNFAYPELSYVEERHGGRDDPPDESANAGAELNQAKGKAKTFTRRRVGQDALGDRTHTAQKHSIQRAKRRDLREKERRARKTQAMGAWHTHAKKKA